MPGSGSQLSYSLRLKSPCLPFAFARIVLLITHYSTVLPFHFWLDQNLVYFLVNVTAMIKASGFLSPKNHDGPIVAIEGVTKPCILEVLVFPSLTPEHSYHTFVHLHSMDGSFLKTSSELF